MIFHDANNYRLGSWKTTLIRHLLSTTDKKLAIVMNEFSEIEIDAKIVRAQNLVNGNAVIYKTVRCSSGFLRKKKQLKTSMN